MPRWQTEMIDGDWCVTTDDGRNEVHVGTHDRSRQWADWYVSKRNMPEDTVDYPVQGGMRFDSRDGDASLYVINGEPVGTLGWNGLEWWFYGLSFELENEGEPVFIDVDDAQRQAFNEQRAAVATMPEGALRDTAQAEYDGRVRLHRDETRELAQMRARMEAKRVYRNRRENG